MFASRGFRLTALFVSLLMAFSMVTVDTAEARRGGSFGSRGLRTFQTAPATPTIPTTTGPIQRSMTNGQTLNRNTTTPIGQQRPGFFSGFGGTLFGGLLFGGLLGMMFGHGFGGIGGLFGLIIQLLIVFWIARFLFRRFAQRSAVAGNPGYRFEAQPDWQGGSSAAQPGRRGPPPSPASARAGGRDEFGITEADLNAFERSLHSLQDAYSREDYEALRRITTPEVMSYMAEELGSNASQGVRNEVYDVRLLQGDIAEAWREGDSDYATVSMQYESRDVTRERATGRIVSGADDVTETAETWTFVRKRGGPWLVSAIQDPNSR